MSAFKDDLAENMKDPEFAYEYGRSERELEIIKLLEEMPWQIYIAVSTEGAPLERIKTLKTLVRDDAIALIKGENK